MAASETTMKATELEPMSDRLLVRRLKPPGYTTGGLALPDIAKDTKYQKGTILASGPGRLLDNGVMRANTLKVGQAVMWLKQAGVEIPDIDTGRDGELLLVCERDIIAVLKPRGDR